MLKRCAAFALCWIAVMGLIACGKSSETGVISDGKIKVSVTFNAMKEFVEAVGKDKVEISTIIPDGMEPHEFEPTPKDIEGLGKAQVFVYNGFGMETWVNDSIQAAGNKDLIVVEASTGAQPIVTDAKEAENTGQYDPHLWLSLKGAEIEVKNIKDGLCQADPDNRSFYEKNCSDYTAQLESLYNEYVGKFQALNKKNIVTGHAAFAYLCRDFGLYQYSVEDVFAQGEPSAQQLAALVKTCKDNSVTTIFAEKMASPAVSQTLANEVGATVQTIYTMESAEDNKNYLQRMQDNLSRIYESLSN